MKAKTTSILTALLLASAPVIFSTEALADDQFKQAVKLIGEKRFDEATKLLKKVVYQDPTNSTALYYLALSQHYQGKTADALVDYQLILKKFPGTDAANRALQAVSSIRLAPGTTDAQWYPKAATKTPSAANTVRTYAGGSAGSSVSSYGGGSLPDQATIFFDRGDPMLKIECFINNRPIKMIFDTGATGVVVGKNQLEEMGIKPPEGSASGYSGGSSNASQQAYWIMNADVKVGTIFRPNFPVKVLSYNSSPPLLGQSFIQDFEYSIDRNAGAIRLKRKGSRAISTASSNAGYTVPFQWEGPKMVVTVEVNGRPYPMYFDTGNSASAISFGMNDLKALNLNSDEGETVTTGGVTGSGHGLRFKVKRIKLGPIEKFDIPVIANYTSIGRPLVGQELYEGYEYTVDNDNKLIRFIRR